MECANKGICDRTTGLCSCFDGFEGSACQRTTCPSKYSGHGTCESIRELGAKARDTLFGIEHPAGAVTYDLWDANSTYGCRCDPWFRGPDCAKRTCKVGVDPLFLAAGTARYETFVIHAGTSATWPATPTTAPFVRLRVFDYYGESYITSKIPILDGSVAAPPAPALSSKEKNARAVANALKAIPNLTFRDVNCDPVGFAGTDLIDFKSVRPAAAANGMSAICQYFDNPGKHRIPEVESVGVDTVAAAAFIVTTGVQGENDEWFTKQSTLLVSDVSIDVATNLILTMPAGVNPSLQLPSTVAPTLLKINADILLASTWTALATGTITLAFPYKKTIGSNIPIFLPVGDDFLTFATDPSPTPPAASTNVGISPGDLIFYHNQFFYLHRVYKDPDVAATYIAKLDKPFGGDSLAGGTVSAGTDVPFRVDLPTDKSFINSYVSECSGRGLCSTDTGVCTCFKGYTNDNCNTQNILAL